MTTIHQKASTSPTEAFYPNWRSSDRDPITTTKREGEGFQAPGKHKHPPHQNWPSRPLRLSSLTHQAAELCTRQLSP